MKSSMQYIVYRRFKGKGIDGEFNLKRGTIVTERGGFLFDGERRICAVTSENGWEHFRPNTVVGEHRQEMLNKLYKYFEKNGFDIEVEDVENTYWKNILRTMKTEELEALCKERLKGG